jgi:beta-hydroxylase
MKPAISNDSTLYKIISASGQLFIRVIETILTVFSKEKEAMIDPGKFAWTKYVEQNTPQILAELKAVMEQYESIPSLGDLSEEQKRIITGERNWKTYMLYTYGARIEKNIRLCPQTDHVIRSIPGMTMAFFSILEPHTALSPHRGPYKGVLRYHLGLIVPKPEDLCGIRINGEVHHWQAGRSLIFDDTYMHDAWNNSDEIRVVLFVDFKRDYIFPINMLNNAMIKLIRVSPFITNVLKRIEEGK